MLSLDIKYTLFLNQKLNDYKYIRSLIDVMRIFMPYVKSNIRRLIFHASTNKINHSHYLFSLKRGKHTDNLKQIQLALN